MFKKVVSFFFICCLVFVVGCGDTSMFNIKGTFENKFELGYPKSDAERFAIEPAVKCRLDAMKSNLEKSILEMKKFQEKISALPATTQSEVAIRLNGFNEHKAMQKHNEELEQDFKSMVDIAACSGYKDLANTYGYNNGDWYWYDEHNGSGGDL